MLDFTTKRFFILGSSGFAREIKAYIIESLHIPSENVTFVDDSSNDAINVNKYHEIVDNSCVTILGSGRPEIKRLMIGEARGHFFKLVHPRANASVFSTIGIGSVIAPGAVISPHAIIGEHVLINYNATVGHDSIIGSLAVVSPNASIGGWTRIGEGSYVGSGAQVRERLDVGTNVMIGMGAIVTKNIPNGHVAIGNPAKTFTKEEWGKRRVRNV
jgi:sugar O-acyltransferase (sialic acid O-acetyltransferase NeuD family)